LIDSQAAIALLLSLVMPLRTYLIVGLVIGRLIQMTDISSDENPSGGFVLWVEENSPLSHSDRPYRGYVGKSFRRIAANLSADRQ
jgi:hypothetical protein